MAAASVTRLWHLVLAASPFPGEIQDGQVEEDLEGLHIFVLQEVERCGYVARALQLCCGAGEQGGQGPRSAAVCVLISQTLHGDRS